MNIFYEVEPYETLVEKEERLAREKQKEIEEEAEEREMDEKGEEEESDTSLESFENTNRSTNMDILKNQDNLLNNQKTLKGQ